MQSPHTSSNPLICAIDTADIEHAITLCHMIKPHVGMVKLGLEFFMAHGQPGVQRIKALGIPIFLDLKLHDIPNTVSHALRTILPLAPAIITLHTLGGTEMLQAAVSCIHAYTHEMAIKPPLPIGVTILTSLDEQNLTTLGMGIPVLDQVIRLAKLAEERGLDGVVCSPNEIKAIKHACNQQFKIIVPGIRPATAKAYDQKRTMTPVAALDQGADYLVIGRPITESSDPALAAKEMLS